MSGSSADHGMAATSEVAKAADGVDDAQTAQPMMGMRSRLARSMMHRSSIHALLPLARKTSMSGRYALAARTSIPSPVLPSENGAPSVLQTPCTLTTCVRAGCVLPVPQAVETTVESAPGMTMSQIIDVLHAMFSGGSPKSGPAACAIDHGASEPCDGLLLDAWHAITKVMKPCARRGRRLCDPLKCAVHVQCDPLDKEEMMGYLSRPPRLRAAPQSVCATCRRGNGHNNGETVEFAYIQFEFCFQMENGNGILKTRGTR